MSFNPFKAARIALKWVVITLFALCVLGLLILIGVTLAAELGTFWGVFWAVMWFPALGLLGFIFSGIITLVAELCDTIADWYSEKERKWGKR